MSALTTFREQRESDLPAVRALLQAVYPEEPEIAERLTSATGAATHVTTYLASLGDEVVGQANVYRFPNTELRANLGFHVHPDHRRRGIARTLSQSAIAVARERGVEELWIRTRADNAPARALAACLGFEELGRGERAPDVFWFRLVLRPAEEAS